MWCLQHRKQHEKTGKVHIEPENDIIKQLTEFFKNASMSDKFGENNRTDLLELGPVDGKKSKETKESMNDINSTKPCGGITTN